MRLSGKSRAFEITAFFAISLCTYQVRAEENELVNIFGRNIIYSNSIQDKAACQGTFDILNHSAKVRRMVDLPYDISRKVVEDRAQVFAREFVENFPQAIKTECNFNFSRKKFGPYFAVDYLVYLSINTRGDYFCIDLSNDSMSESRIIDESEAFPYENVFDWDMNIIRKIFLPVCFNIAKEKIGYLLIGEKE